MTHHDDWAALEQLMNEGSAMPPPMRRVLVVEISISWLGIAMLVLLAAVIIGIWGWL